ncbi:hypothetical protein AB0L70_31835 [Kribbella sp. NPDC051952]|uniref:hypothetical protein n=1 Tax=Kribbella sp. NPDC051952 TaxID=3154851 RepID=UPI003421EA9E
MTEHPGEQFPPDVDPDVEPYPAEEETPARPDYDAEPGSQNAHVDPAEVEFGPEFARAPGEEHEHSFVAESAEDPQAEAPQDQQAEEPQAEEFQAEEFQAEEFQAEESQAEFVEESQARSEDGHPLVEETMDRLDSLRDRPVSDHAEVYADLHERLQSALVEADAEHGDRA